MKLQFFDLRLFSNKPRDIEKVTVPEGSQFVKVMVLPMGVVAYYLIPELEDLPSRIDEYTIPRNTSSIDIDKFEFVEILETIVERPSGEDPETLETVTVVFPVFRVKK